MKVNLHIEEWALKTPFRISGMEWSTSPTLLVEVEHKGIVGRGEAQGVYFLGETAESMLSQAEAVIDALRSGVTREDLLQLLPAGGARNAIDCALWDLECKSSGKTIWELLGVVPRTVETTFTIGLEAKPDAMARRALHAADKRLLKVKLSDDRPYEKLSAIRAARPDAEIIVDANQGWSFGLLRQIIPEFVELGVKLIEQPLPRGADSELAHFDSEIPIAADESVLTRTDLEYVQKLYDVINIKLDKTGGLTEALALAGEARACGVGIMVGNMAGTSLSMAPSLVLAQQCEFVDLDGPLLLKYDRSNGLRYDNGQVCNMHTSVWG